MSYILHIVGPDNEAMEGLYDMESLYNAEHPFINFLKEYYSIDDKWPYVSRNDAIPETRKHKYNAYLLSGYEKYNDVRRSDTLIERKRNTDADRQKERTDCLTRYNNPVLINACLSNIQRSN